MTPGWGTSWSQSVVKNQHVFQMVRDLQICIFLFNHAMHLYLFTFYISLHPTQSKQVAALRSRGLREVSSHLGGQVGVAVASRSLWKDQPGSSWIVQSA